MIMLIGSFCYICFGDVVSCIYGSLGFDFVYLWFGFLSLLMVAQVVFLRARGV